MTLFTTYPLTFRLGVVLLTLALSPVAAFSACGGGGYSGGYSNPATPAQPTPTPTWTPDTSASDKAIESSTGILYAIESARQPIGIWDERLQSLSKTTPFVHISPTDAAAFITREGLEVHAPALAVSDAYGNVIWASTASTSVTNVLSALNAVPEAMQENLTRAAKQVTLAKSNRAHGHLAQALKRLSGVMALKGYPAVAAANALYAEIIATGEAEVTSCLANAGSNPATAKSKLRLISEQYVNTPVDQQVACAIKSLQ